MNHFLILSKNSGRPKVLDEKGWYSSSAMRGVPLYMNIKDPFIQAPVPESLKVLVDPLPQELLVPAPKLARITFNAIEEFRVTTGFATDPPEVVTAAIFMEFHQGLPRSHELIVGGPVIDFSFNLGMFYGHDKRDVGGPMVKANGSQDPSKIRFRPGSNVSEWTPILEQFQASFQNSLDI